MSIPKFGKKVENLSCLNCQKNVCEQPDDIMQCDKKDCPYKKIVREVIESKRIEDGGDE